MTTKKIKTMRTIKFKGQQLSNGDWIVGDLIHLVDGVYISNDNGNNMAHVNPDTVGQFTGFLDKNGKEIYEGDILRSDEYPFSCMEDDAHDNYFGIIEWSDEEEMFFLTCVKNQKSSVRGISDGISYEITQQKLDDFEIVGDIYDPEWKSKLNL